MMDALGSTANRFDRLVEGYFRADWELFPTAGSRAGLAAYDGELEEPTADLMETRRRQASTAANSLSELDAPLADSLEHLDRQAFDSHLRLAELRLGVMRGWRRDPSQPLTDVVESIFELLTRRDLSNADTVHAISRRMARVPDYLRAAQSRIDHPVDLWVGIAERTALGCIDFLRDLPKPLAERHPSLEAELQASVEKALHGINAYRYWLVSLHDRPLNSDFAVGGDALGRLVHAWHGLPLSLEQVEQEGWDQVRHYRDELDQHARRVDPAKTWFEILDQARRAFGSDARSILPLYESTTHGLRDRMVREGILDLPPGEQCKVVPTPPFMRPLIPTAAYSNPGPLDPRQVGVFFVTEPDRQLADDAYRANIGQHYGVEATCVHEAYPGHHVQLCWANRASSLARQMADHVVFMEGWTLYCEELMIEQDWFPDPLLKINHLAEQLWRAYRMVIDVGIHTRRMSVASAVQLLVDNLGFTRERAETELNWYTQSPGVPMSYMLGKAETIALRDRFMKRPGATLKDFHHWLLTFGSVPQRWLAAHLPDASERPQTDRRTAPLTCS